MAGMAGFEPANARVKVWCLTAWRHPNVQWLPLLGHTGYYSMDFPVLQSFFSVLTTFLPAQSDYLLFAENGLSCVYEKYGKGSPCHDRRRSPLLHPQRLPQRRRPGPEPDHRPAGRPGQSPAFLENHPHRRNQRQRQHRRHDRRHFESRRLPHRTVHLPLPVPLFRADAD